MIPRFINISKSRSFFLFGARATGKSTLLQEQLFRPEESYLLDLLDPQLHDQLLAYPNEIHGYIEKPVSEGKFIIIDEVQRVPALLDVVHQLIQRKKAKFALTGSSSRKLKRGAANMLAGRASVYRLFPLLFSELGEYFSLQHALEWGTLPELVEIVEPEEKIRYLQAYSNTYIREEIIAEQIVRKLPPFRRFLDAAAQMNGKIINASRIAADIQTDPSNVRNYFEILEDTLLGFKLQSYHSSIRKRQRQAPKFYWIDTGIARSIVKTLGTPLRPSTSAFGDQFENFIITQIHALLSYQTSQFELSYLQTKDGAEIDLIVERAGEPTLCIEIKSADLVREEQLQNLSQLSADIPKAQPLCLYRGKDSLQFGKVQVEPWEAGIRKFFCPA
ncbi:ATP-binding protein [bacterium]|nr:ATP-binding protein [bacterium]